MPTELIPVIFTIVSIVVLVFVLVYAYFLSKKAARFSEDENKAFEQSNQVMEQALQKARGLLQETIDKARRMLAQTDLFQRELERESKNAFLNTSRRYGEIFENEMVSVKQTHRDLLTRFGQQSLIDMQKAVNDEKLSVKEILNQRIQAEFDEARKEIEAYKDSERKKIEVVVDKIVQDVSKEVIRTSLNPSKQKEIILGMLEKAKTDGMFN